MSTSPNAFAALPLTVLSDPRVAGEQERARALGYAAGYAAGARAAAQELEATQAHLHAEATSARAAARAELERAVAAFQTAAQAAQDREVTVLDEARAVMCQLAFDLAQEVVGAAVSREIYGITGNTLSALTRAVAGAGAQSLAQGTGDGEAILTVHLEPGQAHLVNANLEQLSQELGPDLNLARVKVVADPALSAGHARATYPNGHVDVSLHAALERGRTALDQALAASTAEAPC